MANNRLSEGVGKKIVEALKKQSEIEVNPISTEQVDDLSSLAQDTFDTITEDTIQEFGNDNANDINIEENFLDNLSSNESNIFGESSANFESSIEESTLDNQFSQPTASAFSYQQPAPTIADNFVNELDSFEIPGNIAVLKKLITQLPSGVTRHTGAQIIRQTMEALGISMKSVLQEAQQVQEGLNNSARECQASIQEYKKQIISLEKQSQNHQKQYAALNELISLFIQTGR